MKIGTNTPGIGRVVVVQVTSGVHVCNVGVVGVPVIRRPEPEKIGQTETQGTFTV